MRACSVSGRCGIAHDDRDACGHAGGARAERVQDACRARVETAQVAEGARAEHVQVITALQVWPSNETTVGSSGPCEVRALALRARQASAHAGRVGGRCGVHRKMWTACWYAGGGKCGARVGRVRGTYPLAAQGFGSHVTPVKKQVFLSCRSSGRSLAPLPHVRHLWHA